MCSCDMNAVFLRQELQGVITGGSDSLTGSKNKKI